MGEANFNFASNKYEEAVRMCMEIIRQGKFGYIFGFFTFAKIKKTCVVKAVLSAAHKFCQFFN